MSEPVTPVSPALFLAHYLGASTLEEKRICLSLSRECAEEVRRIAAAQGVALKA